MPWNKPLTLKNRQPTAKQIAYAKAVLAGNAPKPVSGLANAYAHRTLALANGPREEKIILQALRLGEVGITSIPCEVLCEIGLTLKAQSPLPQATFTIELANGHNGYLPTPANTPRRLRNLDGHLHAGTPCFREDPKSIIGNAG